MYAEENQSFTIQGDSFYIHSVCRGDFACTHSSSSITPAHFSGPTHWFCVMGVCVFATMYVCVRICLHVRICLRVCVYVCVCVNRDSSSASTTHEEGEKQISYAKEVSHFFLPLRLLTSPLTSETTCFEEAKPATRR